MNYYSNQLIFFYCLFGFIFGTHATNCLPDGCRIEYMNLYPSLNRVDIQVILCDMNDDSFEFKFKDPTELIARQKCDLYEKNQSKSQQVIFRSTSNELNIIGKRFNFTNTIRYFNYFRLPAFIQFWNINGFDVNLIDDVYKNNENSLLAGIDFSNCRFVFYHDKKKINSCQDVIDLNLTQIESIFHIERYLSSKDINLKYMANKQQSICPLLFKNVELSSFLLIGLYDTFYKKNILSFSNETYTDLNSNISFVQMFKPHNVKLDLTLLNPSVFNFTSSLEFTAGSLQSIDEEIFRRLKKISFIQIDSKIFRRINHKQGIGWIRQMNYGVNVNLSNMSEAKHFEISIRGLTETDKEKTRTFPGEDFCIYADFPFNQLVILYQVSYGNEEIDPNYVIEFTCTYLWLVQYYESYYKILKKSNKDTLTLENFNSVIHSTSFKSLSKCNFEEKIRLCNKSNYQIKDIWDETDFYILNFKLMTAFKISLYLVSFLGLTTNLIVVIVILHKDNNDLFNGFKQYIYLYLNSIFCILILVIELLSWMTECFYPFEVFCPEIRKLVGIQFFKIIFTECLVTMFRFMCNFTYVAFALNRISLIGREHGKLVTFMAELGVKKYIVVALFTSCLFSWIKGLKYKINYFYPELNFPISTESDLIPLFSTTIFTSYTLSRFADFYFTFNLISDLMNYFVFVLICAIIDICMVVQLHRILEEKTKKSESLNQKKDQANKKAENEEVVNKAIKMVVINSAIGIFLKLPVCIVPLVNLCAQFYYKSDAVSANFNIFYLMISNTDFITLFQDISRLLFNMSLSIQIFIYNRFDKKFRTGYKKLKDKAFLRIKNLFKSDSKAS